MIMWPIKLVCLLSGLLFSVTVSYSQAVFMDADNTGNAYARLTSKGYNYEVNDEAAFHLAGAPHINEVYDALLKKWVFAFYMHKDTDKDPTDILKTDRQRNEIKVDGGSPSTMQMYLGDTQTTRWKFKLDVAFQPTTKFTHLHQIKAMCI